MIIVENIPPVSEGETGGQMVRDQIKSNKPKRHEVFCRYEHLAARQ